MFNKASTLALFFFAFFFALTNAIVINPHITAPKAKQKLRAGTDFIVQWDTTYFDGNGYVPIPDGYKGTIKLGYLEKGDPYNEHLFWDLATGFNLNAGSQKITLPSDLPTRHSYIIVLMGNSGNASPKFTIRAAK